MIPGRPLIKWVGGKRQVLPLLLLKVPKRIKTYHEPFVGGGALFFALRAQGRIPRAVLADSNERLMRTYRGVQLRPEEVIRELGAYRYEREAYYTARANEPVGGSDVEIAAWFLYLNRAGFNGLWRVNRHGRCNVPFGRHANPTICDVDRIREVSAALQGVDLLVEDFGRVDTRAVKDDFVYVDSPYVPLSATSSFTSYTAGGFDDAEQVRLRDLVRTLRDRDVRVLASNSSAPRVRELYAGFTLEEVDARRAVNCQAERRGSVRELLISGVGKSGQVGTG